MKRLLLILCVLTVALSSCSDDDDGPKLKLNKLTKVSCIKNNETKPFYEEEVFYNQNGSIAFLQSLTEGRKDYQYTDNVIMVPGASPVKTEYLLKNSRILEKKTYEKNPHAPNSIYVDEEFRFNYTGNKLANADWIFRTPLEDGKNYQSWEYPAADKYIWEGDNIVRFTTDKKEMVYEYGNYVRPENFPFMIPNTFTPVGFHLFDPMNLLYGKLPRNLPTKAYWYNVPDIANIFAEYQFSYTYDEEYLSRVSIIEKIHQPTVEENRYEVFFEYNYLDF